MRVRVNTTGRQEIVIEIDRWRFVELGMPDIDGIGMNRRRLMNVRQDAVLVPFAAVVVRRWQVRVRRRPLHRQKSGEQKGQQDGVKTVFDHDEMRFDRSGSAGKKRADYIQPMSGERTESCQTNRHGNH